MAFDDLSVATEDFINKSVSNHFVNPHAADTERLAKFDLSLADIVVEDENEKAPKSIPESKPEKKRRHDKPHQSKSDKPETLKNDEPEILKNEENIEKSEEPTEPAVVNSSQENPQRRRKRRHHHHEEQQE